MGSARRLAGQVAAVSPAALDAEKTFEVTVDARPAVWSQVDAPHGGRVRLIDVPAGCLRIRRAGGRFLRTGKECPYAATRWRGRS